MVITQSRASDNYHCRTQNYFPPSRFGLRQFRFRKEAVIKSHGLAFSLTSHRTSELLSCIQRRAFRFSATTYLSQHSEFFNRNRLIRNHTSRICFSLSQRNLTTSSNFCLARRSCLNFIERTFKWAKASYKKNAETVLGETSGQAPYAEFGPCRPQDELRVT